MTVATPYSTRITHDASTHVATFIITFTINTPTTIVNIPFSLL